MASKLRTETSPTTASRGNIPAGGTATAKWSLTVPPEHLSQLKVELSPGYSDDTYMTEYDPAFVVGSAA
jgi:hypothetical protein